VKRSMLVRSIISTRVRISGGGSLPSRTMRRLKVSPRFR
jgi:hypothetical protein